MKINGTIKLNRVSRKFAVRPPLTFGEVILSVKSVRRIAAIIILTARKCRFSPLTPL